MFINETLLAYCKDIIQNGHKDSWLLWVIPKKQKQKQKQKQKTKQKTKQNKRTKEYHYFADNFKNIRIVLHNYHLWIVFFLYY